MIHHLLDRLRQLWFDLRHPPRCAAPDCSKRVADLSDLCDRHITIFLKGGGGRVSTAVWHSHLTYLF